MDIRLAVSCTPYATSSRKKTGDIIIFSLFEKENSLSETQNILSKTCDNAESSNKSDDNSNMLTLISKE